MKEMPKELKQKLRKVGKLYEQAAKEYIEVCQMIESYNVTIESLTAMLNNGDVQTEALSYISNAEGDLEGSIEEIEKVFLYYVNKKGE